MLAVDDSSALLGLGRHASKLGSAPVAGSGRNATVWPADNARALGVTRIKKSVVGGFGIDRMSSEVYPYAPPRGDARVEPTPSRFLGRQQRVIYR